MDTGDQTVLLMLGELRGDVKGISLELTRMREQDAKSRARMREDLEDMRETLDGDIKKLTERVQSTETFQTRLTIWGTAAATVAGAGVWIVKNWAWLLTIV